MSLKLTRRSFLGSTATVVVGAHSLLNHAQGADVIPGFDQTKTDYDKTKVWTPFSERASNARHFNSEVGLFRTNEGGMCRIIICHSQGEYLEAGRIRGDYAGYNWHNGLAEGFVGDATGKERLKQAMDKGLQTKKPALPPGVAAGGHGGSHGYLMNDFVEAILRKRKPAVDVVDALNMTAPGYYAHLSAMKDGESMKIPRFSL